MRTIAEVELLVILKEGKSHAATSRHYNESSIRSIKKEEKNIGTAAAISFNKDAKRLQVFATRPSGKRQQMPIIMFFSRKNTHAPRASKEENAAERS